MMRTVWDVFRRKVDPRVQGLITCPKCGKQVKKLVDHECRVEDRKHRLDKIIDSGNKDMIQCCYCGRMYDSKYGACPCYKKDKDFL